MATKKVNSISEFMANAINDIEKATPIALSNFAKDASDILTKLTGQWYGAHMPKTYDRTYEFIDSITIEEPAYQSGGWFVGVYFDPMKMSLGNNNGWNQHEDRMYLSEIIEEGWTAGTRFIQGSGALEGTINWAELGGFVDKMVEEFSKLGFRVK